jgi:hypothetical protein
LCKALPNNGTKYFIRFSIEMSCFFFGRHREFIHVTVLVASQSHHLGPHRLSSTSMSMDSYNGLPLDDDIVDRIMTFCPTFGTLQSTILVCKAFHRVF